MPLLLTIRLILRVKNNISESGIALAIPARYPHRGEPSCPTPLHESGGDYPAAYLTIEWVRGNSYLKEIADTISSETYRCVAPLYWIEDEKMASLNARVDFINRTTSNIINAIPMRDTPITFISLGSGGLLTEFFLHNRLKNSGYNNLSWRFIDVAYQNNGAAQALSYFGNIVSDVAAFTTEQLYLNKLLGYCRLAENDKTRGATVVLTIDPPRLFQAPAAVNNHPASILFKGMPVAAAKKANAIYLLAAPSSQREELDHARKLLAEGRWFIDTDCGLKCSINKLGACETSYTPSASGRVINSQVAPYLESVSKISALTQQKIDLINVDKILDKYLEDIANRGQYGIKFYVSDYDLALANLRDYFIDSNNQGLFASFVQNEGRFEKKE